MGVNATYLIDRYIADKSNKYTKIIQTFTKIIIIFISFFEK